MCKYIYEHDMCASDYNQTMALLNKHSNLQFTLLTTLETVQFYVVFWLKTADKCKIFVFKLCKIKHLSNVFHVEKKIEKETIQ